MTNLSAYTTGEFDRGAGRIKEGLWLIFSWLLFRACPFSFSALKRTVLRAFGARIGNNVTIKPQVKITFPWKLAIGNDVWLGEECWLLNLEKIIVEDNVCISQRAFLCTGSHNYKLPTFDLITRPIVLKEGSWIGAGAWVGPGVQVGAMAVLTACSVATGSLAAFGIYQGNPAVLVRERTGPVAAAAGRANEPAQTGGPSNRHKPKAIFPE
jgi:putative colanic acid biosynthesis acetyltransferase WcaF